MSDLNDEKFMRRAIELSIENVTLRGGGPFGCVIVKDGIVTLTGTVDSYAKKLEAENATKKVAGVKALVEKIEIKHTSSSRNLFAEGALKAAFWIKEKNNGLFSMQDMLNLK
jgi:pyrimidine deaminase RibD-like protein